MTEEGLVISKKPIEGHEGAFEYWVRVKDRSIQKFNIRTDSINVGNRVEVEYVEEDENGTPQKKYTKILRII